MSRSKSEILKDARKALEMLERAQYGCTLPGAGEIAPEGPVDPSYAIGWAKACLRRALELPASQLSDHMRSADQPEGDA